MCSLASGDIFPSETTATFGVTGPHAFAVYDYRVAAIAFAKPRGFMASVYADEPQHG